MTKSSKRVLVAVDGSEASVAALKWAVDFIIQSQDHVVLLQTFLVPITPMIVTAPEVDLVFDEQQDQVRDDMARTYTGKLQEIARAYLEPLDITYSVRVDEGDARDLICSVAGDLEMDCVVVGSRGMGALKRMVLGSVSDFVTHNCPCPVLVVRGH